MRKWGRESMRVLGHSTSLQGRKSLSESIPGVILGFMAAFVRAVVSRVGKVAEVIRDGDTGILVIIG